ncbi:MAG TPA: pyridoxamine 5'-phosphate oxidase, partial [Rhodobacteraceae bacterium]|nr:pyridoxamine 5'-phosphate oxidase [Paracoccaceae bacterium]
ASRPNSILEVHTDIATDKVTALEHTPIAAFHIWLPRANLQIRLSASVAILTGDCVDAQWAKV